METARDKFQAQFVGQLDQRYLVVAGVLCGEVGPCAVVKPLGQCASADMAGGLDDLDIEVSEAVGRRQSGDTGSQHRDVVHVFPTIGSNALLYVFGPAI